METSFPSKLVEATRYGRPLLIWAPADSAAARWGMDGDKALVVTEENPEHLARAIDRLRNENGLFRHYSQRASAAAMGEFNPRVLQEQFRTALKDAIRMGPKI